MGFQWVVFSDFHLMQIDLKFTRIILNLFGEELYFDHGLDMFNISQ